MTAGMYQRALRCFADVEYEEVIRISEAMRQGGREWARVRALAAASWARIHRLSPSQHSVKKAARFTVDAAYAFPDDPAVFLHVADLLSVLGGPAEEIEECLEYCLIVAPDFTPACCLLSERAAAHSNWQDAFSHMLGMAMSRSGKSCLCAQLRLLLFGVMGGKDLVGIRDNALRMQQIRLPGRGHDRCGPLCLRSSNSLIDDGTWGRRATDPIPEGALKHLGQGDIGATLRGIERLKVSDSLRSLKGALMAAFQMRLSDQSASLAERRQYLKQAEANVDQAWIGHWKFVLLRVVAEARLKREAETQSANAAADLEGVDRDE